MNSSFRIDIDSSIDEVCEVADKTDCTKINENDEQIKRTLMKYNRYIIREAKTSHLTYYDAIYNVEIKTNKGRRRESGEN